jgi:hypothetical protein
VKVAEREAAGRRADLERQARELRDALEEGMRTGFAPLAPALSDRIAASLGGLSDSLRQDREERAAVLRATSETVASLRAAQDEWAKSSADALGKLKAQGEAVLAGAATRDAEGRAALQAVATDSARTLQEALEAHLDKIGTLTGTLTSKWDDSLKTQGDALREFSGQAGDKLRENSARAEEWLGSLSTAAGRIGEALDSVRRGGDESAALQAEWRATVDMFHSGLGGLLDRLQSLATYAQGQEALLRRMDETIRSFEERSAELIEDTALKAQESLLDALDQAGSRDAAVVDTHMNNGAQV